MNSHTCVITLQIRGNDFNKNIFDDLDILLDASLCRLNVKLQKLTNQHPKGSSFLNLMKSFKSYGKTAKCFFQKVILFFDYKLKLHYLIIDIVD